MLTKFKSTLVLLCLSAFTLAGISCSKSEKVNSPEITEKLISILSLKTKEDRKIAFRFLSPKEKVSLWKNYLSQALNTGSYSDEQLSLIKESFRFLTPGFFENTITQSGDLFEIWKFKVTKIFSERLKTATFNDLLDSGSFNLTVSVNNPPVSLVVPADCECNTSGDFCGNNNYNIGPFCVVTHKCNTGGCTAKEDGCGWFWSQKCEGKCKETYTGNCP